LAPTGSATQFEGDQFRDLLNDFSQGPRSIDVLENAAAPVLNVAESSSLRTHSAFHGPTSNANQDHCRQKQADQDIALAKIGNRSLQRDGQLQHGFGFSLAMDSVEGVGDARLDSPARNSERSCDNNRENQ
jgi:hypothetical protein